MVTYEERHSPCSTTIDVPINGSTPLWLGSRLAGTEYLSKLLSKKRAAQLMIDVKVSLAPQPRGYLFESGYDAGPRQLVFAPSSPRRPARLRPGRKALSRTEDLRPNGDVGAIVGILIWRLI
jgi:hypothetical protein